MAYVYRCARRVKILFRLKFSIKRKTLLVANIIFELRRSFVYTIAVECKVSVPRRCRQYNEIAFLQKVGIMGFPGAYFIAKKNLIDFHYKFHLDSISMRNSTWALLRLMQTNFCKKDGLLRLLCLTPTEVHVWHNK